MPTGPTVRLTAAAKLTWTLRVVGVRKDGYHLIDAEMCTLDVGDEVIIAERTDGASSLTVSGQFAAGVPVDQSNLVLKALAAAGRFADVHVLKCIPQGGGLGGGSADAAAVFRWAGIDNPAVTVRVGADVPFCVAGGRARVTGIGEVVEPMPSLERVITLVVPPVHVSTPAVYRAWDELGGPTADGPNDLEPAALRAEPELARWRDRIGELSGASPVLAGSGATWFVVDDHAASLAAVERNGATVVVARTA